MYSKIFLSYLQIFNTITTVILNISPIIVIIPVVKGKDKYINIPYLMLFFNLLNASCWGCYWYRMSFLIPVISNYICGIISLSFCIIYLYFFSRNSISRFCLYCPLLILSLAIIIFISLYVIKMKIFGVILIFFNILMFIAPGQNLIRVIKEKNHKLIPIGTTIVGIICSGGWLFFGIIVNDINCIIPNLIGLLSSIFNTFIWIFFYVRAKIINKRNQLYSEETIDQKNKVEIK